MTAKLKDEIELLVMGLTLLFILGTYMNLGITFMLLIGVPCVLVTVLTNTRVEKLVVTKLGKFLGYSFLVAIGYVSVFLVYKIAPELLFFGL